MDLEQCPSTFQTKVSTPWQNPRDNDTYSGLATTTVTAVTPQTIDNTASRTSRQIGLEQATCWGDEEVHIFIFLYLYTFMATTHVHTNNTHTHIHTHTQTDNLTVSR